MIDDENEESLFKLLEYIGKNFEFVLTCTSGGSHWYFDILSKDGIHPVNKIRCTSIDELYSELDQIVSDFKNLEYTDENMTTCNIDNEYDV